MNEGSENGLKLNIQKTKIMASGPITSWQIDGETVETVTLFSWVLKSLQMVTAAMKLKDTCSFGRKAMTNHLDSILKSRDITLLTDVCLVKAKVFPVVMYGCESWTIKKTEGQRTGAFEKTFWCLRRLLRIPWTERRSNQSILKEIYFQNYCFFTKLAGLCGVL